MTVLLINPSTFNNNISDFSLAILSLHSSLVKEGYDTIVLNNFSEKELLGVLNNNDISFAGLTTNISKNLSNALKISEIINGFDVPVFWGGPYATSLPEQALRNSCVDGVVIGEGELTVVDVARSIEKAYPLKKIDGIAFKENRKIIKTPARKLIKNLDNLPIPSWELIDEFPKNPFFGNNYFSYIESSRGCSYNCNFCFKQFGNCWRSKTPKRVVQEIKKLNDMDVFLLSFIDDNFFIDRKRALDICQKIINEKIHIQWTIRGARVDAVDKKLLELMKKSGCLNITFGVESGSQRILNLLNKNTTVDQIITAFDICHEVGIATHASLMTDIPTESITDIKDTLQLIKRIQPSKCTLWPYYPFPKTVLYTLAIRNGFKEPKNTKEQLNVLFYDFHKFSYTNSRFLWLLRTLIHIRYNLLPYLFPTSLSKNGFSSSIKKVFVALKRSRHIMQ